jgi:hypothetical protein
MSTIPIINNMIDRVELITEVSIALSTQYSETNPIVYIATFVGYNALIRLYNVVIVNHSVVTISNKPIDINIDDTNTAPNVTIPTITNVATEKIRFLKKKSVPSIVPEN